MKKVIIGMAVAAVVLIAMVSGCDQHKQPVMVVQSPQQPQGYMDNGMGGAPVMMAPAQPQTVIVDRDHDSGVGSFMMGAMAGHLLSGGGGNRSTVVHHYNDTPRYSGSSSTVINRNTIVNRPSSSSNYRSSTYSKPSSSSSFRSSSSYSSKPSYSSRKSSSSFRSSSSSRRR